MYMGYWQSLDEYDRNKNSNIQEQRLPIELNGVNTDKGEEKVEEQQLTVEEEYQSSQFTQSETSTRQIQNVEQMSQISHDQSQITPLIQLHDVNISDSENHQLSVSELNGKVLLVVNVALDTSFAESNFHGLQMLHKKYGPYGLQVLAFPCTQFTIWDLDEQQFRQYVREKYGVTFPLYQQVEVNGRNTHPLFGFIKQQLGFSDVSEYDLRWNFQKILINRRGQVVRWFDHTFDQLQIENAIYELLVEPLDQQQQS
eukprot:TRINITY_DN322_c1_g1_i1.p1 TRINITY_DN322_c1_g1~~TRINITY_DN322_c1_g1_i1.p1  ORF type:complete len:256 (+),score=17.42 TRINITY_DN322_c1_g1_i1:1020-1787(+)